MRSWSLKIKFGVYSATLATVALLVAAAILLPTIYYRQRAELDRQLSQNAGEFFRDLENFKGAPVSPRHPLSAKFLPLSLKSRYIVLKGPEGQILYQTPELEGTQFTRNKTTFQTLPFRETQLRVGFFQARPYSLQIGADLEQLKELHNTILLGLAFAAPITALVVFLGGFLLAKFAVRPVTDLTTSAEQISINRLDDRLPTPPSRDEIYRLSKVLNDAFDRLKNAYSAATRFSADASHQLKTPIAVLRLGIEALLADPELDKTQRDEIRGLLRQTRRLTSLIDDLLLLAQADAGRLELEPETTNLSPLIEAACEDLEAATLAKQIEVQTDLAENLVVRVDTRRLRLALQVLMENAAKYTTESGTIHISATLEGQFLLVQIGNTAPAIPPEDRATIFERFRRGSGVGENIGGFGLGLNIAHTLAVAHGGDLTLENSEGDWVKFQLKLPISQPNS